MSAGIGIAQDMGMAKDLLPCHEHKQAEIPGELFYTYDRGLPKVNSVIIFNFI